jgi:hypothetical protein
VVARWLLGGCYMVDRELLGISRLLLSGRLVVSRLLLCGCKVVARELLGCGFFVTRWFIGGC